MPRAIIDKVESIQGQMGDASRELEILRENQKEMLEMKDTLREMKTAFGGLSSRLDVAEERISGLEGVSESLKTEKQREQSLRKTYYSRTVGELKKFQYVSTGNTRERRKRGTEELFAVVMTVISPN